MKRDKFSTTKRSVEKKRESKKKKQEDLSLVAIHAQMTQLMKFTGPGQFRTTPKSKRSVR